MEKPSKPFQTQVIYLFAILCGVLGAVLFLYSMGDRRLTETPQSISSPAPISANESKTESVAQVDEVQPVKRNPAAKNLIETLTDLDPDARWEVSEHSDGRPSHILGGRIKCPDRECNAKSVYQVLKTIAAAMEVDEKDLRPGGISVGSNSHAMEQYYKGYPVFNSTIKAFATPNGTEIYHVVNDLRKIDSASTVRNISKTQARNLFAQKFSIEDANRILFVNEEPIVYGQSATENRLVWWVQYGERFPTRRSIDAFVDTESGHITVRSEQ